MTNKWLKYTYYENPNSLRKIFIGNINCWLTNPIHISFYFEITKVIISMIKCPSAIFGTLKNARFLLLRTVALRHVLIQVFLETKYAVIVKHKNNAVSLKQSFSGRKHSFSK